MEFAKNILRTSIDIQSIISIHYFEYTKGFAFTGEVHDFWEIVYADRNQLLITAGNKEITLNKGELYLHRPMEFHNLRCEEQSIANSVVISFASDCSELFSIAGRIIKCDEAVKQYMANIISEAALSFSNFLGDPYNNNLVRRKTQPFGSEQLITVNLQELLIHLVRNSTKEVESPVQSTSLRTNEKLFLQICEYLRENCRERITFEQVCNKFSQSPSSLKRLFAARMDYGIMEYFGRCKVDLAKELIRQNSLNFSNIAAELGYSSVQYFSRHFKAVTGMTPSQYATSVKAFMNNEITAQ